MAACTLAPAIVTVPPTTRPPLTETSPSKVAFPTAMKVPPIHAAEATSKLPLIDTSSLNSVLDVNVPAPATARVPPTDTLLFSAAAPTTVTVLANVAAPPIEAVLCR